MGTFFKVYLFNTGIKIPIIKSTSLHRRKVYPLFCYVTLKRKESKLCFQNNLNRTCVNVKFFNYGSYNNRKLNENVASCINTSYIKKDNIKTYKNKGIHGLNNIKRARYIFTFSRKFSYSTFETSNHKPNNKIYLTDNFLNQKNLKKEILNINKMLTENSFIQKKKEEIYYILKSTISPNFCGKIYFIGSCENNIWIKNSDIDCCIVVENCEDKNSYLYILKVIKSAINLIYPLLDINIIKASVPVAKIYKEQNNICDISINNTVAIVNTKLVSALCDIDERITIINRIIKYWAKQKNINNRSQGTFSSYALFLLTYYFFQNLSAPILPSYKSIERENASSFEINSEYFFSQHDVPMPFYTEIEDIKSKIPDLKQNQDDISNLLYGFFEFYSSDICKNGITLDIYNNQIIENKDMTANIYCPITKKIVNTYSINTWKKMFEKIQSAYNKLKNGSNLNMICEETKDNTHSRKIDLKDHLLRRKIIQNLYMF